tara:strand:+ start:17067 stop:17417 length:351 start_codon:yes stop_codon:yes gene_type:complete
METNKLVAFSILLLLIFSCQSKKEATHSSTETMNQSDLKMSEDGFKKAIIVYSEVEGDCPYTLSVDGESTLFDPINLGEEYKKSQTNIWVKYRPLRMPNRCEKANPVEITEISSRN